VLERKAKYPSKFPFFHYLPKLATTIGIKGPKIEDRISKNLSTFSDFMKSTGLFSTTKILSESSKINRMIGQSWRAGWDLHQGPNGDVSRNSPFFP